MVAGTVGSFAESLGNHGGVKGGENKIGKMMQVAKGGRKRGARGNPV